MRRGRSARQYRTDRQRTVPWGTRDPGRPARAGRPPGRSVSGTRYPSGWSRNSSRSTWLICSGLHRFFSRSATSSRSTSSLISLPLPGRARRSKANRCAVNGTDTASRPSRRCGAAPGLTVEGLRPNSVAIERSECPARCKSAIRTRGQVPLIPGQVPLRDLRLARGDHGRKVI